ncbi:MAG: hypothetical protein ACYS7Y_29050, partial [Planctomycetota bacterium]
KEWEASYRAGTKVGAETYCNPDGIKKWQKDHREDGSYVLTVWGPDGKEKARSVWRDKKLISHELVSK